ncbi:MAG TPA: hypothetical protein VNJ51_14170 [Candidatus Dormibacteraeota bacterium]|nr:hypothetical protein [Candidatus Dormibacteraeota bacterium]
MDVQALLNAAAFDRNTNQAFFQSLAAILPDASSNGSGGAAQQSAQLTLPAAYAQIFTGNAQPMHVSVQLVHNPDEVVYVFTDASTGQVVFSVPPEIVVKLAEMFNSTQGILLDGHS